MATNPRASGNGWIVGTVERLNILTSRLGTPFAVGIIRSDGIPREMLVSSAVYAQGGDGLRVGGSVRICGSVNRDGVLCVSTIAPSPRHGLSLSAPTIGAIRTTYAGVEFRSRTEARWAVFFDTLKIPWRFEDETYDLPSGWYLPDFWLPEQDCYWEVKGSEHAAKAGYTKAEQLAVLTGKRVIVAHGSVGTAAYDAQGCRCFVDTAGNPRCYFPVDTDDGGPIVEAVEDFPYFWCQCRICDRFGVEYDGRAARVCRHTTSDKDYNAHSPDLCRAYTAARTHSFWDPA